MCYPGTPGNKGQFLQFNPAKTIDNYICQIKHKKNRAVFVLGDSFGASVALNTSLADKIIAISPVINWKSLYQKNSPEENYATFLAYLITVGYNINHKNWTKLKSDNLLNSINQTTPTLIMASKNDPTVKIEPLLSLKQQNHDTRLCAEKKHLSFRTLNQKQIIALKKFLLTDKIQKRTSKNNKIIHQLIAGHHKDSIISFGSQAADNSVPESDLDLLIISDKPVIQNQQNRTIELKYCNQDIFKKYSRETLRGAVKLITSNIIRSNNEDTVSISSLKSYLLKRHKPTILLALLLEQYRFGQKKYPQGSPIEAKFAPGGRRHLGFMTVANNIINNRPCSNFWESLHDLLTKNIINYQDISNINIFFYYLQTAPRRRNKIIIKKHITANTKIVAKFFHSYFAPRIMQDFSIKIKITEKRISADTTRHEIKDMFDALFTRSIKHQVNLWRQYQNNTNHLVKHIIFYYLACNQHLSLPIAKNIINLYIDSPIDSNIIRNIVQNSSLNCQPEIIASIKQSPDIKIQKYLREFKRNRYIFSQKIIRG